MTERFSVGVRLGTLFACLWFLIAPTTGANASAIANERMVSLVDLQDRCLEFLKGPEGRYAFEGAEFVRPSKNGVQLLKSGASISLFADYAGGGNLVWVFCGIQMDVVSVSEFEAYIAAFEERVIGFGLKREGADSQVAYTYVGCMPSRFGGVELKARAAYRNSAEQLLVSFRNSNPGSSACGEGGN